MTLSAVITPAAAEEVVLPNKMTTPITLTAENINEPIVTPTNRGGSNESTRHKPKSDQKLPVSHNQGHREHDQENDHDYSVSTTLDPPSLVTSDTYSSSGMDVATLSSHPRHSRASTALPVSSPEERAFSDNEGPADVDNGDNSLRSERSSASKRFMSRRLSFFAADHHNLRASFPEHLPVGKKKPVSADQEKGYHDDYHHHERHRFRHALKRILHPGSTRKGKGGAMERRRSISSFRSNHRHPTQATISYHANEGVGLKTRRLSLTFPDDFEVHISRLSEDYVRASKVPGKRGKNLGKGATATVQVMASKHQIRETKDENSVKYFAVKEFRKCDVNEDKREYIKKVKSEYSIAASLQHPNLVETFSLCTHKDRLNHVMELCVHGDLFSLVQRNYLKPEDNLCFFKQTARGVSYLHGHGIAHRDLKLENLLLTEDGHVKITDFGVSEVFSGIHPGLRAAQGECGIGMRKTSNENGNPADGEGEIELRLCAPGICGSTPYISPEVIAQKDYYDPRCLDVWSLGIVMITLACRGNPWPVADLNESNNHPNYAAFLKGWDKFLSEKGPDAQITHDEYPKCGGLFGVLSQIYSAGLKRLLLNMLCPVPSRRFSIQDVMQDLYFIVIECCVPEVEHYADDRSMHSSVRRSRRREVLKFHKHAPPKESKTKKYMPNTFDLGDGH